MKKTSVILILILLSLKVYSQDKKIILLDEKYKEIGFDEFNKKAQTDFFYVAIISTDTAVFKKLRFKEIYGKLNSRDKYQLDSLLQKKRNIDTTKVWVIHYKDSLPDVKKMRKKSGIIIIDSTGKEKSKILSWDQYKRNKIGKKGYGRLRKYVTSYKDFKKGFNREKKYLRNQKKIELLHFYNINKGYPLDDDEFNWMKDTNQILRKIFTIGVQMYKTIVLHPDGNFYVITHNDSLDKQKKAISLHSFKKSKKIWLKEYDKF